MNASILKCTRGDVVAHVISAEGVTAGPSILKLTGPKASVARLATGDYQVTFAENVGQIVGIIPGLWANDPTALAGHTVVAGELEDSGTDTPDILVNVTDAADAPHDLVDDEYFTLLVFVSESGYPEA